MFVYTSPTELKKEIKKAITSNDTTAKAICDTLGVSPMHYQQIFRKKNLSFSDINDICNAMDCDLVIDIVRRNKS